MDVERIQKINALAVDLMKQGLATDREDAVAQAERVFRSRDADEDYSVVRKTMKEVEADARKDQTTDRPDLSAENVRNILQQNTTFLVNKIKEFQEKVETLEKEIADLKTKMTYQRSAPPVSTVSSPSSASVPEQQPRGMPKPAQNTSKDHPRSGNYNENDVSIEKFFYMGNK